MCCIWVRRDCEFGYVQYAFRLIVATTHAQYASHTQSEAYKLFHTMKCYVSFKIQYHAMCMNWINDLRFLVSEHSAHIKGQFTTENHFQFFSIFQCLSVRRGKFSTTFCSPFRQVPYTYMSPPLRICQMENQYW